MTQPVLIPLVDGEKRAAVRHWANLDFESSTVAAGTNVGLRTGGLVIVDADSADGLAWWKSQPGSDTPVQVRTPKGVHFYYQMPPDTKVGPSVNKALGLDVRAGTGSYVVYPGSTVNGHAYAWVGAPWDGDPASLPLAPMESVRQIQRTPEPETPDEGWDVVPEGHRNNVLTALAGAMRRQGAGAEAIALTLATFNRHRCVPPLEDFEIVAITRSVLRYEPDPDEADGDIEIVHDDDGLNDGDEDTRPNVLWMEDMTLQPPPAWHFHPYLPAGRLILMDGYEGIGKGMFATWAATQMAAGGFGEPGAVLWGSTEDDPEEDIQRRLLAAGYLKGVHARVGFLNGEAMYWRFPGDIRQLAETVRDNDVRLLILDPGRSLLGAPEGMSMGEFSYNNEAHIRPGLERLGLLARKLDCTVLFIHHWNKSQNTAVRLRSGGTGAFAQTVRHRITLHQVGDQRAIAVEKSNMASREYTVRGYWTEPVDEFDTAKFVWGDQHPALDLDEWEKTVKEVERLTDDEEVEVHAGIVMDEARRELGDGARFWNREGLCKKFGLTKQVASAVLKSIADEGLLLTGPNNTHVWNPSGS